MPVPDPALMPRMKRRLVPYLIAALLVLIAANYGVSRAYGAHPFWADRIAWIGVPAGLLFAFLIGRMRSWKRPAPAVPGRPDAQEASPETDYARRLEEELERRG